MNREAVLGWVLAVAAVAVGYVQWGWQGAVFGLTVVAFWMLLQFSRALRAMREAAGAPVGMVPSAVMLHARLRTGMKLPQLLRLTRSLGYKAAESPETFEWADASGARVRAEFEGGRLVRWELRRPAEPESASERQTPTG